MKKCAKCKQELSLVDFPDEVRRKDGKYPWCRLCLSAHRKERYVKRKRPTYITHKVCSLCKQDKPRNAYRIYKGKTLHYRCISCEDEQDSWVAQGKILCTSCNIIKPKEDFIKSRQNLVRSECKECSKKYVNDNKARIKNNNLLKHYGITLEQYNQILKDQDYSCAVCKRHITEFNRMLAVDHAHSGQNEGHIRGLCCDFCNRFIINKHTSGQLLRNAADYLDKEPLPFKVPIEYLKGRKKRR